MVFNSIRMWVVLTGLSMVFAFEGSAQSGTISPASGSGDRFSFAMLADPQVSAENNRGSVCVNAQETTAQIANELNASKQHPAFVVWLGDLVNVFEPKSVDNFRRLAKQFHTPNILLHGNHDTRPPYAGYAKLQKELTGVASPFYSFDAGKWHFVFTPCNLDGNSPEQKAIEKKLLEWLEKDLATHKDRPTIVFNHLHFMPQGLSQTEFYQQPLALRKKMLEVMTRHGNVKYYFNGHVHNGIQTAEKVAWAYKGIQFFTVPTIIQPRPYGEEYPAFKDGIERGGYYVLVDVDGDKLTLRGRLAGTDKEYVFPETMFKPFDEQKNPLWFHSLPELTAKPMLENGDFSKGFTGWTLPDRYHRDSDPFFVAETDGQGATFTVKTPVESLWSDDEYLQASQVVALAPGQSPVLGGRYLLNKMPKAGGGYVTALLMNDTELKALMMFRWSTQEERCNYLPRCLGYQLNGKQVSWMYFQELGKKKQGMFWRLPTTTNQWHTFTLNVQELYDTTHTAGDFARLGATKVQVAVGVWNQNNLPGMSSGARFADLVLTNGTKKSAVDDKPLSTDAEVFTCQFGQKVQDGIKYPSRGIAEPDWWPTQKAPAAFVTAEWPLGLEEQVILQAVAGLKARAVNEGRGDELVWMDQQQNRSQEWRDRTIKRLTLKDRGTSTVHALLTRAVNSGLVKGYVFYSADAYEGRAYEARQKIDPSLNTATMAAARLCAVPVTTVSEGKMKALGLSCLFDSRGVEPLTYFEAHRADFEARGAVGLLDPKTPNNRDLMIAHTLPVTYGTNAPAWRMLDQVNPPAAVIGWGVGDEFRHCQPVSTRGHFHTVSNWILNAPFYSAGANKYHPKKLPALNPTQIDWKDTRRCVAFMNSDGDNAAYIMGNFWSESYWDSSLHGTFPMGWSLGVGDMTMLCPVIVDRMAESKPKETTVVQFGGGYFYPDHFASARSNRWDVLRLHARRINATMERTGVTVLTMIFEHSASADSQKALRIFAEEIPSLLGIMVMDYAPYHGGDGRVDWIPNGRGGRVPAVCARYCLWDNMNRPRAGSPERVAQAINTDETAGLGGWVAVNAWSQHKTDDGQSRQGLPGVNAVVQGIDTNKVHVVCPEELLLRIRRLAR
jgi:hypothetical protein